MTKCSVVLMYETYPKPVPLGLTDDPRLKVLVKRQLIKEAEEALRGAEQLEDPVLVASFHASLNKLQSTLELLIPNEFEDFYLLSNESDDGEDEGNPNGHKD